MIRETVKNAMDFSKPVILDNFNDGLNKMVEGLNIKLKNWKENSKLINYIKNQKTLDHFI